MGFAIATICGHVDGIRFHLYITAGLDPKNLLFGEGEREVSMYFYKFI